MNQQEIDEQIEGAVSKGISLTEFDKAEISKMLNMARNLGVKLSGEAQKHGDPMEKGQSFPMGVGFTRMTKRSVQRLDGSVKNAGTMVLLNKKKQQIELCAAALLSGRGTEADLADKKAKQERQKAALIKKILNWNKGDCLGEFVISKVNFDRNNYPTSFVISGAGVVKGVMDKVDIAREFFGGDKAHLARVVDIVRLQAIQHLQ